MNFNNITLEISAGRADQLLPHTLPEIAFSGKSNVGKSSLLNVLVNRKALARVSATPGKTVTVNFFSIDGKCKFIDLPGYGYAKVSKENVGSWSPVTDKYFTSGRKIELVVQLLDIRHDPTQNDLDMINYLVSSKRNHIIVLTKSDKLNKTELAARTEYFNSHFVSEHTLAIIPFSAVSRSGRDEILNQIENAIKAAE